MSPIPMTFYVVRVNRDPSDTHAATDFMRAIDLAMPDRGDRIEYAIVVADDPGSARLMVRRWHSSRTAAYRSAGFDR